MDYAVFKKMKLFVVYVDFSKAYDRVPRQRLLGQKKLGCGATMLNALAQMYNSTQMMLNDAIKMASIGVRQGSPSSCFLFTLYVNELI